MTRSAYRLEVFCCQGFEWTRCTFSQTTYFNNYIKLRRHCPFTQSFLGGRALGLVMAVCSLWQISFKGLLNLKQKLTRSQKQEENDWPLYPSTLPFDYWHLQYNYSFRNNSLFFIFSRGKLMLSNQTSCERETTDIAWTWSPFEHCGRSHLINRFPKGTGSTSERGEHNTSRGKKDIPGLSCYLNTSNSFLPLTGDHFID